MPSWIFSRCLRRLFMEANGLHVAPYSTLEIAYQPEPEKHASATQHKDNTDDYSKNNGFTSRLIHRPLYLFLALAVAIVLAVALGVGLGVGLRNKNSTATTTTQATATTTLVVNPSASPSQSSTASSASTAPTSTPSAETITQSGLTIRRDCPDSNSTTVTDGPAPQQTFIKHCSFLYKPEGQASQEATFRRDKTESLDDCISYCAAFNMVNATGPWGPCTSVCWRTDPEEDLFGVCWGQYGTRAGWGQSATNASLDNVPVDSALLLD